MVQEKANSLLKSLFPFWDTLEADDRNTLASTAVEAKYKKDDIVHGGDTQCGGAVVVTKGCLRAYIMSEDGKEITLYRLFPGDMCMLAASCVLEAITFDVYVDAQEDSECCLVSGHALADITSRNTEAKVFALELAVNRFSDVMWVMQQILFMSFDKRLAIFLWDEAVKSPELKIKLTHEQIAKYMCSAREVVTRMLKYFTAEGIVHCTRGGITVINKEKLRSLTR